MIGELRRLAVGVVAQLAAELSGLPALTDIARGIEQPAVARLGESAGVVTLDALASFRQDMSGSCGWFAFRLGPGCVGIAKRFGRRRVCGVLGLTRVARGFKPSGESAK
jgi:hypothetical protein